MGDLLVGEVPINDMIKKDTLVLPPEFPTGPFNGPVRIPDPVVEQKRPGTIGFSGPGRPAGAYRGLFIFLVGALLLLVIYLSSRAWAAGTALFLIHPVVGWLYVAALACTLIPLSFATASALARYRRLRVVTDLQDAVRLIQTRGDATTSDQFHKGVTTSFARRSIATAA